MMERLTQCGVGSPSLSFSEVSNFVIKFGNIGSSLMFFFFSRSS